ncbi:5-oxoprolinase subunit PxpA [Staphylococcus schleiferi subsp. coagulans]|uniref:5-oxoprolinase subunit PxpA n=1 Tax=Staphylococcus coagulans TaxID=74706 RepID=UPI0015F80A97|nr:5-oxoprolinase subunit PxpA [Staphylococcus coagulans]MBA8779069.1 5-oxoprolinase subunit PxpA [Staphylococcus coagulans]
MKIDLNCDLGESFGNYKIGNDQSVIPLITSANIACGFHAGDVNVMAETVKLAKQNHVGIGAHPGFPDLQGFGRRNLDMSLKEIFNMVVYQGGALKAFCDIQGVKLNHVKPHGALYQMASRDAEIAKAITSAIYEIDPKLYLMGLSNSILIDEGRKQGLNVASEVFADRRYENDGQLVSRKKEGAVIEDSYEAIEQVLQMVKEGTVKTISGEIIDIKADTICVHGDGAHALEFVKQIRSHLSEENVDIRTLGG